MIDDRLLFSFVVFAILLILGIRTCAIFIKWRTKYNLATLIIIIIFLAITVFDFLSPEKINSILAKLISVFSDSASAGNTVRILIFVIFVILLCAFLFYPDVKRFLIRQKRKNK